VQVIFAILITRSEAVSNKDAAQKESRANKNKEHAFGVGDMEHDQIPFRDEQMITVKPPDRQARNVEPKQIRSEAETK
jgi:hypothetical protein